MIAVDILATLMLLGFLYVWHRNIQSIPRRVRTMSFFAWIIVAAVMGSAIWW